MASMPENRQNRYTAARGDDMTNTEANLQDTTARLPLTAQFLLLAYGRPDGTALLPMTRIKAALAGAAVVDLTLGGALELDESGRKAKLYATDAVVEPSLREAQSRSDGQTPKNAIARIGAAQSFKDRGGDLRDATFELLTAQGYGRLERDDVFGIVPRRRWHDSTRGADKRASLLAPVRAILTNQPDDADTDERVVALMAVAHATKLLPKLFPDLDRHDLNRRGKEIMEQNWAGSAVYKALQELDAAAAAAASG